LLKEFGHWRSKFGRFIDPALIFRIRTNARVDETSLEALGLRVLSVEEGRAVVVFATD
jgi:hypothetical protein